MNDDIGRTFAEIVEAAEFRPAEDLMLDEDRQWFAENPGAPFRFRHLVPNEFGEGVTTQYEQTVRYMVVVVRRPSLRMMVNLLLVDGLPNAAGEL